MSKLIGYRLKLQLHIFCSLFVPFVVVFIIFFIKDNESYIIRRILSLPIYYIVLFILFLWILAYLDVKRIYRLVNLNKLDKPNKEPTPVQKRKYIINQNVIAVKSLITTMLLGFRNCRVINTEEINNSLIIANDIGLPYIGGFIFSFSFNEIPTGQTFISLTCRPKLSIAFLSGFYSLFGAEKITTLLIGYGATELQDSHEFNSALKRGGTI